MSHMLSPARSRPAVGLSLRRAMNHPLSRLTLVVALALAAGGAGAVPALASPTPRRGRTVIVRRVSGKVRVRQPHGRTVTVRGAVVLRSGGRLFTTGGVAAVTVSTEHGSRTADVSRGDSRVTQRADGKTTFALTDLPCTSDAMSAARRPTNTLWVHDHHGPFISRGGYASGAARGTEWTTTDTCDATTIRVRAGKVLVTDFVKHLHVLVSAGHSYTAHAPTPVPDLAWTAPQPIGNGGSLNSVSCPTTSFCAAVDGNGDVLTSTDPAGGPGTWTLAPVGTSSLGFTAISCPSPSLCLASETLTGDVYVSTDPTGGAGAWSATTVDSTDGATLYDITCPTAALCLTVDGGADVYTTTDPVQGSWSEDPVDPDGYLNNVTCAGAGLCIAVGTGLSTSTDPAGGTGAWRTSTAVSGGSATCPRTSLCLIGGGEDDISVSTDPAGGPSTYTDHDLVDPHWPFATITGIACPGTNDCLAVDNEGDVMATGDPASGHWTMTPADPEQFLNAISCPSTRLCVAVDGEGDALVGTATGAATGGTEAGGADVSGADVSGRDIIARSAQATATAASTRVVVVAGFTVGGRPAMRITHTVRGSCFSTSDAAPRDDAYRCMSGNELFDPCLAPPRSVRAGKVVVCPTDPFRDTGIEIRLTRRLPHNTQPAPSDRGVPFAIRLTNGCEAMLDTGATATIGRTRANYYCARTRQVLWGAPSRRGRLWTIWSAPATARRLLRRVSIAQAWF
jgi:hypothetical protein